MRKARAWFVRVMGVFGKARRDRELEAELDSHLQMHIDDNLRAGMTPEEARRRAIVKLGGVESTKESYRERRSIPVIETLLQDVRFGLRMLRRNPGFALAVVLTLALGIGANVTMFSVVDALLFRMPEHVRAPEQLVRAVYIWNGDTHSEFPGFRSIQENDRSIDLTMEMIEPQDFDRGAEARQVNVDFVDANYFGVLGTNIEFGRLFSRDEDAIETAAPVAILSYQFWQKQFGGDFHALGRQIWVGERSFTVIGVAPKGFNGEFKTIVDMWLPFADSPTAPKGFSGDYGNYRNQIAIALGRLRVNMTPQMAATEANAIYLHSGGDPGFKIDLIPLFQGRTSHLSDNTRVSLWLAGVALVVLLIGCANVANLFLVRVTQRQQEMAIRLQLGASRRRLLSQVLVESLLLTSLGGVTALLVVSWSSPLVRAFLFRPGFFVGELLNYRVVAMTCFFSVLAGLSSGATPAWRASRANMMEAMKSAGHGQLSGGSYLRSSLLVGQVALTLLLTIGAGLFIHSLKNVRGLDLGFEPDHALVASVDLRKAGFQPAEINAAYERMLNRVVTMPGVESAGLSTMTPLETARFAFAEIPAGMSLSKARIPSLAETVSPGYMEAVGMRLVQGRTFQRSDRPGAPDVVIVNQSFAREVWPHQNPLGKCFMAMNHSAACWEVIGVVKDISLVSNMTNMKSKFYVPLDQALTVEPKEPALALVIRTSVVSGSSTRVVFSALESVVPNGRFVDVHPLSQALDPQTRSWRLGASMFSFFGALALLLAAVGIYGVLAFLVRHRTSEIGIRMALGAMPQDILRLIVWQGMKFVGLGLVIGIGAALGLSRVVRSLLFEVTPTDVWSYAGASGVLIVVALAACLVPAWRAARVDPSISLRYE